MEFYKVPNICANCGIEPGTNPWTITTSSTSISPLTLLGIFFGISVINRKTYTFDVSICDACRDKIHKRMQLQHRVSLGCYGMGIAGVLLWVFLAQTNNEDALTQWIVIVLAVWLLILVAYYLLATRIGSFNGKYFGFKNPMFFREFALLNPDLVKPSRQLRQREKGK